MTKRIISKSVLAIFMCSALFAQEAISENYNEAADEVQLISDDSENEVSYKLHGKDKDLTLEKIKQIYGVANKGLKGDARRSFKTGWFDWTTDLIAAPIFMRLGQTAQYDASTIVGNGPRITTNQYTDLVAREQARQINKPSSSLL